MNFRLQLPQTKRWQSNHIGTEDQTTSDLLQIMEESTAMVIVETLVFNIINRWTEF